MSLKNKKCFFLRLFSKDPTGFKNRSPWLMWLLFVPITEKIISIFVLFWNILLSIEVRNKIIGNIWKNQCEILSSHQINVHKKTIALTFYINYFASLLQIISSSLEVQTEFATTKQLYKCAWTTFTFSWYGNFILDLRGLMLAIWSTE